MDPITIIHDITFRYLEKNLHKTGVYFVPRKINNQGRLDKGYWFIGNEDYLQVSFWLGTDNREKIHNISMVICEDCSSYIELSATDSQQNATVLKKITKKLGGFTQYGKKSKKQKWFRNSASNNFLQELDIFLKKIKPLIDNHLRQHTGISIIPANKTCDQYISRISKLRLANKSTNINTEKFIDSYSKGNLKTTFSKQLQHTVNGTYILLHNHLQNSLFKILESSPLYKKVQIEKDRVDIKAQRNNGNWQFYEIKTNSVLKSIREGLGQILEYSCFPAQSKATKLIIVATDEPNKKEKQYLHHLRGKFNIPLYYQCIDYHDNMLSQEY